MKAALLYAPGDYCVEEVADPRCGEGDIVLEVKACAICGTDVKAYASGHSLIRSYPVITGHELAGRIVEVGAKARQFEVDGESRAFETGQRVVVAPVVACESCSNCKAGRPESCTNREDVGFLYNGGYAQKMLVPQSLLSKKINPVWAIPDGVGYWTAAVCEPAACAIHAQKKLHRFGEWNPKTRNYESIVGIRSGDLAVVIGGGPLGDIQCELARSQGARVLLAQRSSGKLELARRFGIADHFVLNSREGVLESKVRELTGGEGADIVITACPDPGAQQQALRIAKKGGCISLFGSIPKEDGREPMVAFPTNEIHNNGPALCGTSGASPYHLPIALAYARDGVLDLKRYITHALPLEELERVLMIKGIAGIKEAREAIASRGQAYFNFLENGRYRLDGGPAERIISFKNSILKALVLPSLPPDAGVITVADLSPEEREKALQAMLPGP